MTLKEYRHSLNLTAKEAAMISSVPLRTYNRYENEGYGNALIRKAIINSLKECFEVSETKGILTISKIKETVASILSSYSQNVEFCYLFGSYAKGLAKDSSDVDLCISTTLEGLDFVGLIEELRVALHKKVDLINLSNIKDNIKMLREIMKDGIKIYS